MSAERSLFSHVLVPVASESDAAATAAALKPYLDGDGHVTVVHVIEKAGGAPDKASVEQRKETAADIFARFGEELGDVDFDSEIHYGTDVAETIVAAAAEVDASAIVFSPREGSRWVRLLTGDVSLSLVTGADRPVLVLPDAEEVASDG